MKIFLLLFLFGSSLGLGGSLLWLAQPTDGLLAPNFPVPPPNAYMNLPQGYALTLPPGFAMTETGPELVRWVRSGDWLRVNAGCFDFGLEGLARDALVSEVTGHPAMREDYYSGPELRLRRYVLYDHDKCLALELYSGSPGGWEQLEKAVETFRFTG